MSWYEYLEQNDQALRGIPVEQVSRFVVELKNARKRGATCWVLGNGGSASAASHAVADFGKTSKSIGAPPLFTLAPSEMSSMQTAYSNDISFEKGFASTILDFAKKGDLIWIISVSGKSPNLIKAADAATSMGLTILSTVGAAGQGLASKSNVGIVIPSSDYQVVENAHITLMHWFTKELTKSID